MSRPATRRSAAVLTVAASAASVASVALAAGWAAAPAPAATVRGGTSVGVSLTAPPLDARQGDVFFVDNLGANLLTTCTIGTNDTARRVSYAAGHCVVRDGVYNKQGALVYLADATGKQIPWPAGTIYPAAAYDPKGEANDWSEIHWFTNVNVAENRFGGATISASELTPGDTVCYHGYASHGRTAATTCGPFVGMIENTLYFDAPGLPQFGDSGGPVFVPGRGVVGVMSGANYLTDDKGSIIIDLERASTMCSGNTYDGERVDKFLQEQLALRRPPATTTSAPAPTTSPTTAPTTPPTTTMPSPTVVTGAATPSVVPSVAPPQPEPEPTPAAKEKDRTVETVAIVLGVATTVALVPIVAYLLGLI